MKKTFRIPGFLPPEKQDIIHFHVLKKLSYSKRMTLYFSLIVVGFAIQIIMLRVWPGAVFLIFASILNLVRGYKSIIDLKAFNADSDWTRVDMNKINEVGAFNDKLSKWDVDMLDISNAMGFLMFVLSAAGLMFVSAILRQFSISGEAISVFVSNAIILIFPLWFNGLRRVRKQDVLSIKTNLVMNMESFFKTIRIEGEDFNPAIMLVKDKNGKSVPTDCRFTISFKDMPADFYGIQAQININSVEGTKYPYFYCVIAAKTAFGLGRYANIIHPPKNVVINYEEDNDAEVIVIRQHATKTSGYHTKINDCKIILDTALKIFREILR
jgi:hypothetical protein